ncbi:MAG: hypothetical protein EP330_15755 [Deltaproteobacteria bacterium]|nr:MAG: hypothetical protein EP330_15755 [Deltaproteobacteria bacterium]
MNPTSELVCLLGRAQVAAIEARVRALWPAGDLAQLDALADLNRTIPLALKHLRALGLDEQLPAEVLARWQAEEAHIAEVNLARRTWTERFLERCRERSIDVILLKGIGFAETLYAEPTYKRMNDSDILVRPEDVDGFKAVLAELGFVCVTDLFGVSIFPESSHHCPPYLSPDRACVVGTHWGLVSPKSPFQPDLDAIWRDAVEVDFATTRAWRMSWEDNLLHLAIHLPYFKTGVRELADVYNLVLGPGVDWERFEARVRTAGAEDAVYRVLSLADAMQPIGIPEDLRTRWRRASTAFTRKDVDTRLADVDRLVRSRSVHLADIEREQVIFLLSGDFGERSEAWLGIWRRWLRPDADERERLIGRAPRTGRLGRMADRVSASRRIWHGLALDHGHGTLVAILVAAFGVLGVSGVQHALGLGGERLQDHPAAELLRILE